MRYRRPFRKPATLTTAAALSLVLASAAGAVPIIIVQTATPGGGVAGGGGVGSPTFLATRFQAPFTGNTNVATVRLVRPFNFGAVDMFAAVIALTGAADFADSSNLTTPDVLGSAVFSYTGTSNIDKSVALSVPIVSGQWYALAFGAGLRGSSGANIAGLGYSLANTGPATTFFSQADTDFVLQNYRFVLTAEAVPEPGSALLLTLGLAAAWVLRRRRT